MKDDILMVIQSYKSQQMSLYQEFYSELVKIQRKMARDPQSKTLQDAYIKMENNMLRAQRMMMHDPELQEVQDAYLNVIEKINIHEDGDKFLGYGIHDKVWLKKEILRLEQKSHPN